MGGSAVLDAANNFMAALRQAAGKRLGCAESNVTLDVDKVTRRRPLDAAQGVRRAHRRGRVPQQEAHLQLRRACRAHHGRSRKLGRIEIVDYVVVQDVGRAVNPLTLRGQVIGSLVQGLGGAVLEDLKYDEQRPVPHRLARRLSAADRDRLPQSALRRARRLSVADQPARRQGRGRGRHHRRRRLHGERGGQRAAELRRRSRGNCRCRRPISGNWCRRRSARRRSSARVPSAPRHEPVRQNRSTLVRSSPERGCVDAPCIASLDSPQLIHSTGARHERRPPSAPEGTGRRAGRGDHEEVRRPLQREDAATGRRSRTPRSKASSARSTASSAPAAPASTTIRP